MSQQREPHIFHLPEGTAGGMAMGRYQEIEEAEAGGSPLKLSNEERAEYEEACASMKETMGQFHQALTGNFGSMFERLALPTHVPFHNC